MANVIDILNTIRANQDSFYQDRIPVATATNIEDLGGTLLENEALKNQFLNALIHKIAFTIVSNRRFKNPLAVLKKGTIPFGTTVEEIFTNPVGAKVFDGSNTSDMLEVKKPDTKTIYHERNRQDKYSVSISNAQLRSAFKSAGTFETFLNSIITAMYSGDEMDEYFLMRKVLSSAISKNKIVSHTVTYDGGEESCKELIKGIKTFASNFTFPSTQYNGYNKLNESDITSKTLTPATTWSPREKQVLLIRSDVDSATDVEVLAKAFNMEKTDFLKRKIVVDTFGDDKTLALLCDESLFQIYDNEYVVKSFDNGSNLTTNYWLHHWQTISLSLFANAVAFKQEA